MFPFSLLVNASPADVARMLREIPASEATQQGDIESPHGRFIVRELQPGVFVWGVVSCHARATGGEVPCAYLAGEAGSVLEALKLASDAIKAGEWIRAALV